MIKVKELLKKYGELTAVNKISFNVEKNEIFGFLGPNGAGKTTTLEMIEGLRRPDDGQIFIKDIAVWPNPNKVKKLIGVQLQSTSFYEELKVKETLMLFAALYNMKITSKKATDLLDIVGLTEKQNDYFQSLSGGQKQRLAIVTTLVNDPDVIFLDEPTTGLDPQARRRIWEVIQKLKENEKTVVLTTHYMEEAQVLADRVAIIDQGQINAIDTPKNLIENLDTGAKISFVSDKPFNKAILDKISSSDVLQNDNQYTLFSNDSSKTINTLLKTAGQMNATIADLHVQIPTLEDVFIAMTGKELRD